MQGLRPASVGCANTGRLRQPTIINNMDAAEPRSTAAKDARQGVFIGATSRIKTDSH